MDLKGKVALVTGGSRGIGRAVVKALVSQGAQVIFTYRGREDAARGTVAEIKENSEKVWYLCCDVTDRISCGQTVAEVLERWGRIDILVNNAGITKDNILVRMSTDDWDQVIATNLTGVFNITKPVIKPMLKQKQGGSIINISSIVGLAGSGGQTNYAAAKAGIIGFTKSLAKELAGRDITVNAIAPGFISTDMTLSLSDKTQKDILAQIPLGRMGNPEDVADLVVFLAGTGKYITGQVIAVDGGLAM